ncbi:hypothetical protein [Pseudomonas syringae]|jgi:hypothetical protein|uniref:Uncharacterized protein n=3 Tax=Pseudomonas syringae group TaxID=136849 RepID=A0AB35JVW9_PSESY|nr:hypothetical protein [Pseudomonas syringae]EPF67786.1 Hypothetical protein PssSM_3789 [Pseudomonas syringae pv. syringae SM]MBI6772896.1 hypothetical protein [Pseudomonas syringae]MBI6792608.1 hypothetical protein [Pseudomonas syringae]MBI6799881.1 hypothetical protein [Pseudomonas syringae]MBI6833998.1 hypothetical protein [Pseudomonas syringae]
MKLSQPQKLLDLDTFLPSDGEDAFDMSYSENYLTLNIFYDPDIPGITEAKKSIRFLWPSYFIKTPFPGHSFFSCPEDRDLSLLNCLVEYKNSEMLDIANKNLPPPGFKHYRLYLQSEGSAVHVIAQSVEILN